MLAIAVLAAAPPADAGGMTLPLRGVRSLARGGALVAGASDADALWQNPAGLAHGAGPGKRSLLFELGLVYQPVEYTAPDGERATNEQPTQPLPALAGALGIGDRFVIAGGVYAPAMALHRYPATGPTRFQSVAWSGSTFLVVAVGAAYQVSDRLRVGATLQNQFSQLAWSVVMAGCPPMQTCAPDDRTYELPVDIEQTDYLAPSGSIGVQLDASSQVTVGLALEAPRRVAATGTLTAKLPTNTQFDGAQITGDAVEVAFTLPPIARLGVEVRPLAGLRIEAAAGVELWSLHDEISIAPDAIQIENIPAGPLPFRRVTIARDYGTSVNAALGAEHHGDRFVLGAGLAYETAAAPASHVSVLTVDTPRFLLGVGGGYEDAGWQIGGAIGYVHAADVTVSPDEARIDQLAPIGEPTVTGVNAGRYATRFVVAGLRFARRW